MKKTFTRHDVTVARRAEFIRREYGGDTKAAWHELVNECPAADDTLEQWQQDYARGLSVLRNAKLISTERLNWGIAVPAAFVAQLDSPAIAFEAGHIGTQAVQRYWGLIRAKSAIKIILQHAGAACRNGGEYEYGHLYTPLADGTWQRTDYRISDFACDENAIAVTQQELQETIAGLPEIEPNVYDGTGHEPVWVEAPGGSMAAGCAICHPRLRQGCEEETTLHDQGYRPITIAETIATLLGNDGTRWETEDGRNLEDICREHEAEVAETERASRYRFADGSAIIDAGGGWDVEGSTPYSWAGCEDETEAEEEDE